MNSEELEKRVRHIQIHSRKVVDEILAGEYHSSFKGTGIEFEDIREYQYGDDVRTMDWNVTARTGKPFVKLFNEERELTLFFLLDISASLDFGSTIMTKRELAARVLSLLGFASANNNDNTGLILFTSKIEHYIRPKKGRSHILNMISTILSYQAEEKGTDIKEALSFFQQVRKKRCIIFVLSDFFDNKYKDIMKETAAKHDLVCMRFSDPHESAIVKAGMIELKDAETGTVRTIDFKDKALRKKFAFSAEKRMTEFREFCYEIGADLINISTDDDYLHKLILFFRARNDRSADAR